MKRSTILLSALSVLLLSTACKNSGFKKTQSGLLYKIVSTGSGPKVKRGDVIKLQFVHKLRDSVLASSYEQMPFYAKVDSVGPVYDPQEIFTMLRKGDSAVVIRLADSLAKKQGMLPEFIKPKDKLVLSFKVVEIFTVDSLAQRDQMTEMQAAQKRQSEKLESLKGPKVKEIEEYLTKNKIQYQKGPEGTFIEIKDPGNGAQIDSGKYASIRYTGKVFPSMKVFESNMEAGKEPFNVQVGTHAVIPGWDEGLKYFKQGGKGTLYIPFFLAYGAQPGPGGKQYENLVFDIEVAKVSDTAPKQAMPNIPMPQQQQQHGAGDGHNH
ncbi:FKBP-type peptidyl-prolyl cis-trans isomerase [Longitalea luteola]|uniref:FKBP-type peptidyl-prolyl cis-trans isomerase n=1 Tax=Longitalea luteola TaxID=2812563 RepID=UPI001A967F39|nr:FKBP-type peptidyl-prolyl cis-trans isomerase [Longitalea luteola]